MPIDVGDRAPGFDLPADDGRNLSLAQLKGESVALYFYPKDDTSGCTKEAEAFRDLKKKFGAAGVELVGVSKDTVASHKAFKSGYGLNFPLVSDTDGKLCGAYGVWVEKSMYGRKYFGIERSTFLIDAKGIVRRAWRKVKVPGHAEDVLAAAKAL